MSEERHVFLWCKAQEVDILVDSNLKQCSITRSICDAFDLLNIRKSGTLSNRESGTLLFFIPILSS